MKVLSISTKYFEKYLLYLCLYLQFSDSESDCLDTEEPVNPQVGNIVTVICGAHISFSATLAITKV